MRASAAMLALSALSGQAAATFVQIASCSRFMDASQPWHEDDDKPNWMQEYGFKVGGSALLKADRGEHLSELLVSLTVSKERDGEWDPIQGKFNVVGHTRHCFDNHGGDVYVAPDELGLNLFNEDPHFVLSVQTDCGDGVENLEDFFGDGYHRCEGAAQPGVGNVTRHYIPGMNLRSIMVKYPEHMDDMTTDPLKESTIACCDLYPSTDDAENCAGAEILAGELKDTDREELHDLSNAAIMRDIYSECEADRKSLNLQVQNLKSTKHCAQSGYLSLANALTGIVVGGVSIILTATFMYCCCMKRQGVKMTFWRRHGDSQL